MNRRPWIPIAVGMMLVPAGAYLDVVGSAPQPAIQTQAASPASDVRAVLDRYCVSCHNDKLKTAGLSLVSLNLTRVGELGELGERGET